MVGRRITSTQNQRVKHAARLRQRQAREEEGRLLVDGWREVARAADSGVALDELYICGELAAGERLWVETLEQRGVEVFEVPPQVFAKVAYGDRREGVVAVAQTPRRQLDSLDLSGNPLVIVLEGVEKPGNVGAVLRTADAAGATALIVADGATDLYNPNTIRASLGAVFSVPVCAASAVEALDWLRQRGLAIFASRVDGAKAYTDACYRQPCALVLGSESRGLTPIWQGEGVATVALPMRGVVDSLNISATAAVLLYEAVRQRPKTSPSD